MNNLSDVELVQLARTGNKEAMNQLLQQYEEAALAVVMRFGLGRSLAGDLVQESMLQAWLALDQLKDPGKFGSWLCGIARNMARNHLRRQRTAHMSLESMLGGVSGAAVFGSTKHDPANRAEQHELETAISSAVDKLPEVGRATTYLYYFEGMSVREIAAALDISESAVKSRLFKARRRLRQSLAASERDLFVPHSGSVDDVSVQQEEIVIPVTVADVVGKLDEEYLVVVLHDEAGERILPIWVGAYEAQAIAMGVREHATARPMTYNFVAAMLEAAGTELLDVRVDALRESTFYAIARIRTGESVKEVDARPSDALALALRVNCPINVVSDLMNHAARPVPVDHHGGGWHGRGVQRIIDESPMTRRRAKAGDEPEVSVEEKERQAREALLEQLFGDAS